MSQYSSRLHDVTSDTMDLILIALNNDRDDVTRPSETIVTLHDVNNPTILELYDIVHTSFPHLACPYKYILYWRLSHTAFLPIYDYLSLSAALSLMVDRRVYVVEKRGRRWCKERHPINIHRGRPSDVALLVKTAESPERSREHLGYSVGDSTNMRLVLSMLKGVPKGKDIIPEDMTKTRSKDSKKSKGSAKSGDKKGGKKSKKGK